MTRTLILKTLSDHITDFLYYDRKEDEELPPGAIEEAIAAGEVSVDELVAMFRQALEERS